MVIHFGENLVPVFIVGSNLTARLLRVHVIIPFLNLLYFFYLYLGNKQFESEHENISTLLNFSLYILQEQQIVVLGIFCLCRWQNEKKIFAFTKLKDIKI